MEQFTSLVCLARWKHSILSIYCSSADSTVAQAEVNIKPGWQTTSKHEYLAKDYMNLHTAFQKVNRMSLDNFVYKLPSDPAKDKCVYACLNQHTRGRGERLLSYTPGRLLWEMSAIVCFQKDGQKINKWSDAQLAMFTGLEASEGSQFCCCASDSCWPDRHRYTLGSEGGDGFEPHTC